MNNNDMTELTDDDFPVRIDLDRVSKEKTFLAVTRLLAVELSENPYLTIGYFLQNMTDHDLSEVLNLVETEEDNALGDVLLITEMLAQAEGLSSENLTQLTERCNSMLVYFVLESLYRKKLVNINRNHMSFGDEFKDKEIASRIDE